MLHDFPFTGIGLGQFDSVFKALYAPVRIPDDLFIAHAHNLLLQYAVELGVPGVLACALLGLAFFRQVWIAIRADDPLLRWTGLGLALGVLGFLVYGLTDAIAPGARGGLLLWVVLGLGAAVGRVAQIAADQPPPPRT
jgi:putative inorganic carbon (HCO3(-)) transporter